MTEQQLEEARMRAQESTAGPFEIDGKHVSTNNSRNEYIYYVYGGPETPDIYPVRDIRPNLEFLVHAREDVLDLCEEVSFLKKLIYDLKEESSAYERGLQDAKPAVTLASITEWANSETELYREPAETWINPEV